MMPGFTCCHVSAGDPVLRALHDEPLDEDDSGWSLTCGRSDHATTDYRLVNVERLTELDRSLESVFALPVNTLAHRSGKDQPWVIEPVCDSDQG